MQISGQKIIRTHKQSGWRCYSATADNHEAFAALLLAFARRIGTVVAGRNGALIEPIAPRPTEAAEERSLSAAYGLSELPMHIDTAHYLRPARYLLLGCANPGQSGAQTRLAPISALKFSPSELSVLASAAVLVRTGRRSFYSTILDKGRPFLRYDPGCMEPLDARGEEALQIVSNAIGRIDVIKHEWRRGEILLIDNWHMLHGRTATAADSRLLFRVSVQ
ncbi:TauD/TfdA family dioxygenase [Sphingobium sp. BHU LFT2]|uniref:TauD/TfdA family dioxygenase n=1 Tax=Sphingobium sp. BHU LFT2 TaxID=2807634 RepID=UPI001BEB0F28|nr:TauD/TfdA family dioxygenase [Sphingobium sp. BHU LFT2]